MLIIVHKLFLTPRFTVELIKKSTIMKSLIAITIFGMMSFFSSNNTNIILDEFEVNMVNLDYESELESVEFMMSDTFYLQNIPCDGFSSKNEIKLEVIDLQIPNYKYLEELDTVEFNI